MKDNPPAEVSTAAPSSSAARRRNLSDNARLLYYIGVGGVVAACGYFGVTAEVDDPLHLYAGLVILGLACLPGLIWAKNGGRSLPLFEVLMLTTANTFAMPILTGHDQLRVYGTDTVTTAALAVILYQLAAIGAYFALRGRPGRTPFFTREVMSEGINRYIGYGLTVTTIFTCVTTFTDFIPYDLLGVFRSVCYGIGLVAVFVQARRWGQGILPARERTYFLLNLAVQVVIQFSTLYL
ncbi:MAG TPA: hypothetical protein VG710_04265, partial [Opitutus sp.]|nr:hypothetical protein [Opitutus sp.]